MDERYKLINVSNLEWKRISINEQIFTSDMSFKPAEIVCRNGEKTVEDSLIITQKYPNFNGRIITEEAVLIDEQPYSAKAQWDTGATYSSISRELFNELNLNVSGKQKTETTGSSHVMDCCELCILLNNDMGFIVNASVSDNIGKSGIDLLIGMDIIWQGDFRLFKNDEGIMCFSFEIHNKA